MPDPAIGSIVRLKAVVASARALDPGMTGEVIPVRSGWVSGDFTRVRWSGPVPMGVGAPQSEVWEYSCDLEPASR